MSSLPASRVLHIMICIIRLSHYWRMRSGRVVRVSGRQCRSRNCPGFDPSILQHGGIWWAADEEVLTIHIQYCKSPKISPFKRISYQCLPLISVISLVLRKSTDHTPGRYASVVPSDKAKRQQKKKQAINQSNWFRTFFCFSTFVLWNGNVVSYEH